jgi:hypothetical protein
LVTSVPSDDLARIKSLHEDIDRIDTWVNISAENGLFKRQKDVTAETIQGILQKARDNADIKSANFSISNCETNRSLAVAKYYEALNSTPWFWRFTNVYAGFMWLYLVGFLVCVFLFYYFSGVAFVLTILRIAEQPSAPYYSNGIYAATWGLIGGVLRGFWYLKENVSTKDYRNAWTIWFLSCPFIGSILGIVSYFILTAGLITLTKSDIDINNPVAIMAVATVTGFSWPATMALIKKAADLVAGTETK